MRAEDMQLGKDLENVVDEDWRGISLKVARQVVDNTRYRLIALYVFITDNLLFILRVRIIRPPQQPPKNINLEVIVFHGTRQLRSSECMVVEIVLLH